MTEENQTKDKSGLQNLTTSLRNEVGQKIGDSKDDVYEKVVSAIYDKEISLRASKILEALELLSTKEKELAKIAKPDVISYDADGNQVEARYSRAKIAEMKKAEGAIKKLEESINKALLGDMSGIGKK